MAEIAAHVATVSTETSTNRKAKAHGISFNPPALYTAALERARATHRGNVSHFVCDAVTHALAYPVATGIDEATQRLVLEAQRAGLDVKAELIAAMQRPNPKPAA